MRHELHPHQAEALAMLRRSLGSGSGPAFLDGIEYKLITDRPRYLVSSKGDVVSLVRAGRFLRQTTSPQGYLYVSIMDDAGRPKKCLVHRLVAQAFIDNPDLHEVVNHKDGVKTNNIVENLEWCTYGQNNEHARNVDLAKSFGSSHYAAKLTEADIATIRELGASGRLHRDIAAKFGVCRQQITKILSGQAWARAK